MTLRKATTRKAKGSSEFPVEASAIFDEIPEQRMAELRAENARLTEEHDLELLDGFDFPYRKGA